MSSSFDAIDRAILYHLQENARRSITDIADAVDVADNTVRNRIRSLEEEGVIEGYQVNINYDRIDVQHYYVFFCTARISERERLVEEARTYPRVLEVISLMTGKNNVLVVGAGSEKDDMADLARDIDDTGLEIEREYLVRRHHRKPYGDFELDRDSE